MARIVLSPEAQADSDRVLTELARDAGLQAARRYAADIDALYVILADHPESCPARPILGDGVRIGVVKPHIVIHAHDRTAKTATILRIVHAKRRINRSLLRGHPG